MSSAPLTLNTPSDVKKGLAKLYPVLTLPSGQTHARNSFAGNAAGLGGGAMFQLASAQAIQWTATDFINNSVVPAGAGQWPLPAADTAGMPSSSGSSSSGDFSVGYMGGGHVAIALEQAAEDSSTTTSNLRTQLGQQGCSSQSTGSNTGADIGAVKFVDISFIGGAAPHGGAVTVLQGDPIALVEDDTGGLALNTSLERGALIGPVNFSSCIFAGNVAGGAVTSAGGALLIEGRADTGVLAESSADATVFIGCEFAGNRVLVPPASVVDGLDSIGSARAQLAAFLNDSGLAAVLAAGGEVAGTSLGAFTPQEAADSVDYVAAAQTASGAWFTGGVSGLML